MKKIAFTGFWNDFNPETLPLTQIIKENIEVQYTDVKQADYVLFSVFSEKHWFVPDNCIKIFYTGENITPDFNACDYGIGFDWLDFGDRYLRFPLYYLYKDINEQMESKHIFHKEDIKNDKTSFCSMTISNDNRDPIFKTLFEKLSNYKRVESGGKWNNNIGGRTKDKYAFDLSHKFSIVCENCAHPGYTTEKIVQAFAAKCIPIYWGDPTIGKIFNRKAFINVQDYNSIDDVIETVKCIDNDEQLYYRMLSEPALIDQSFTKNQQLIVLKHFLANVFNQPKEKAYRRNRVFYGEKYIQTRRKQAKNSSTIFHKSFWKNIAYYHISPFIQKCIRK